MEEQAEQHQKWWQQLKSRLDVVRRRWLSLWQQIKKHPYATGVVVFLVLILFIFLAYWLGWDWTGFNSGTSQITVTSTSNVNYTATLPQPSKSLWDWMQLLIIPVALAIGGFWLNQIQKRREKRMDFLRRFRTAEITIIQAKYLLNAHRSANTYTVQFGQLTQQCAEVVGISEELEASGELFTNQVEIIKKLKEITKYLQVGADEYLEHHNYVIKDQRAINPKENNDLKTVIDERNMNWTQGFMDGDKKYTDCTTNLVTVKGMMRKNM